jgi:hypothetical protein
MFRKAIAQAQEFTFPVVQYWLTVEGKCMAGAAACIVINSDGWIITAGHVMKQSIAISQSHGAALDWEKRRDAIRADGSLSAKEREKHLKALGHLNKKAARRSATNWGFDRVKMVEVSILEEADLAVGRLDGFDKTRLKAYPIFKDPSKDVLPEASLCKFGYPFVEFSPTYDEVRNHFDVPLEQRTVPQFPIEGIFTRTILVPPSTPPAPCPIMFIETSSPGLRGQSGGPTFDTDGRIWAIQSQTRHLPLGFSPEIKHAGKTETEHQFLNVGMGVHVETVLGFLRHLKISVDVQ